MAVLSHMAVLVDSLLFRPGPRFWILCFVINGWNWSDRFEFKKLGTVNELVMSIYFMYQYYPNSHDFSS
jgi:hypothetical protein